MKKLGIAAGILAGILLLAAASIYVLANPNQHRERIQAELEKQLGRKVTLGNMSLGFLPLRFEVANPVIAEDPAIGQQTPFVRSEKLGIQIGLLPLLQGNVRVNSLELIRPSVELVKTAKSAWNFSTVGPASANAGGAPERASGKGSAESEFTLDKLAIVDGQIGITDLEQKRARVGYDHIDLTVLNYSAGKPFSFDLAAHIQGEGAQLVGLKGEAGPLSAGDPADTPFHATLNLKQVGIDGLMRFLDTKAITKAKGVLSGESEVASQSGSITTQGKLKLDGAQFNDLNIGYPIAVDYKLAAKIAESLVTIESATFQLGQTPLAVSGTLNAARTPLVMDLRIKSGDVSIAEIARVASAFGVAFGPGTAVAGRVSGDLRAKGPATKPDLTGSIAGRDLQISGDGIRQPVHVASVDLALSPTAIRSNEFNATSGTTKVAAQFGVRDYTSSSPSLDLQLKAPNATLPDIQSIAKAYGVTGLDQIKGAGALNLDLRAAGSLQSLTSENVMRALNGSLNVDFSPLSIAGFDALSELGKIGGFGSGAGNTSVTEVLRMTGNILVKNGIAQTSDLQAKLASGTVAATGTADLATEALDLKLAAVFSKEFSDKVGGSRVGGYLTTALSNSGGELVIPALVTGTFKQPKFSPDAKGFLQLQTKRLGLDSPGAAVSNLLGAFNKKKDEKGQDQPAAQQPADTVKSILGGLIGKKKPN